jgi:branched-chain amino acid aminotransferase
VLVWLNGALVEQDEAVVPAFDHGLTVGDGVFETMKVVDGRPFALTRHLSRLSASAIGLGLPEPDDRTVRGAIEAVLAANDTARPLRLRITYTAGRGPLGSDRGTAEPTLLAALAPLPPWPPSCAVATVPWTRNERSATAGLKTTSYADNVRMLAFAKSRGASEAVMANTVGNLCEGTGSNVFLVLDGRLLTPPLSSGCLAGVTRALVLEWLGAEESDVPLAALFDAEEVFLTSATRDVLPVHAVDRRSLPTPGPLTTKAVEVFTRRSAVVPDP